MEKIDEKKEIFLSVIMSESIENLKSDLEKELDLDWLEGAARAINIEDEPKARQALSMALQARKLEQTIEENRISITRPHLDFQRVINKIAKDFKSKLESIQDNLQNKIENWLEEEKENPFGFTSLSVEDGMILYRNVMEFNVVNENEIPREFLIIDESKIKKAIDNGLRNISGIEIKQTSKVSMRIKN